MNKTKIFRIAVLFLFCNFILIGSCLCAVADWEGDAEKQMDKIEAYCNAGQIKKAKDLLKIVKKELIPPNDVVCEASTRICLNLAYCEVLIKDKEGLFDTYNQFIGKIIEIKGHHGGFIIVKGKEKTITFYYDYNRGLLTLNENDRYSWVGSMVKVYYDSSEFRLMDGPLAEKIVFLPSAESR